MILASRSHGRNANWPTATILLLLGGMLSVPVHSEQVRESRDDRAAEVAAIRAAIEALKADTERRIAELEERLSQIGATSASTDTADADITARPGEAEVATPDPRADDLASIREAARRAVADLPAGQPARLPAGAGAPAVGKERNANLLNPEISFTGVLLGVSDEDDREAFDLSEFELDLQSALDPFSRTRVTLAVGEEGVELEEIYVNYSSLPGGLDLLAGKFRQRFGPLNRQHLHALPQNEYPLVYQTFFGEEGLAQTGLSFNWLLPRPWASANEVTLELTNGENEEAFAGESFGEAFSVLGRLKNFWDLSEASYFEWGVSAIAGKTASDGDSSVYGTDWTLAWQPPGRAKYRGLTWRTEVLQTLREDDSGVEHRAVGGYSYLEGLMRRNLFAGIRVDYAEDPFDPARSQRGIVPYLTWWQSEYVRLRAEYGVFESDPGGASEDRFALQLTWAAGPHKHESY